VGLFSALNFAIGAAHTQPLMHTEVRWLSRFCEPREGLSYYFSPSEESELADLLNDKTWCNKVAYLADVCQALNILNKSMQF
jgi:hypothetical protein